MYDPMELHGSTHHSRGLSVKHEDQIETKGVICTALRQSSLPVDHQASSEGYTRHYHMHALAVY